MGWSSVVRTVWGHSTAEHTVKHKGWYSNTQPSAGVAVVSLAWYAATSLVLGTPTTPPLHSLLPHKDDGRSGKGGEEGRGMTLQTSTPTFH